MSKLLSMLLMQHGMDRCTNQLMDHTEARRHREPKFYRCLRERQPCPPRVRKPQGGGWDLSLIHISEPTRLLSISYAVFCLKKKKKNIINKKKSIKNTNKYLI
eukprot:TRINITY_DN45668_c0_g1_i1.p1 TRINITY_DN45668_c0_g1~~TRINITY_DN45668_c0_g1_i1.p1  ORF type:complete len:103 (-),score=10.50 TRINITY_DN45668_c0_g1_i1:40-348(-)